MIAQQTSIKQRRRGGPATLVLVFLAAFLAAFSLHAELPYLWNESTEQEGDLEEDEANFRRALMMTTLSTEMTLDDVGQLDLAGDYDAAFKLANGVEEEAQEQQQTRSTLAPLPPYTLEDAINEEDVYEAVFAVIVYNPQKDKFLGLLSKNHRWTQATDTKLMTSMRIVPYLLRKLFPERFQGAKSPELAIAIGSGDYPHVKLSKLPHNGTAPVLQFGSAFRDTNVFPNMMAMPMPGSRLHLHCFVEWVSRGTVCQKLRAQPEGGLVFGDELDLHWDDLIVSNGIVLLRLVFVLSQHAATHFVLTLSHLLPWF